MDPKASCWNVSNEVRSSCEAWNRMAAVLARFTLAFKTFLNVVKRDCTRSEKVDGAPGSKTSSHSRSCFKARVHPLALSSVDCISPWSQAGPWRRILWARPIRLVERSWGSSKTWASALTPSLVRLPSLFDLVKSWR